MKMPWYWYYWFLAFLKDVKKYSTASTESTTTNTPTLSTTASSSFSSALILPTTSVMAVASTSTVLVTQPTMTTQKSPKVHQTDTELTSSEGGKLPGIIPQQVENTGSSAVETGNESLGVAGALFVWFLFWQGMHISLLVQRGGSSPAASFEHFIFHCPGVWRRSCARRKPSLMTISCLSSQKWSVRTLVWSTI